MVVHIITSHGLLHIIRIKAQLNPRNNTCKFITFFYKETTHIAAKIKILPNIHTIHAQLLSSSMRFKNPTMPKLQCQASYQDHIFTYFFLLFSGNKQLNFHKFKQNIPQERITKQNPQIYHQAQSTTLTPQILPTKNQSQTQSSQPKIL